MNTNDWINWAHKESVKQIDGFGYAQTMRMMMLLAENCAVMHEQLRSTQIVLEACEDREQAWDTLCFQQDTLGQFLTTIPETKV